MNSFFGRRLQLYFGLASLLLANSSAFAANQKFGLGIVLGEPSGLTGKVWSDHRAAIDFGLAFAFDDYILMYADYLHHFPGAFGSSSPFVAQLNPYLGIGAIVAFDTNNNFNANRRFFSSGSGSVGLGARIPLGIEWRPSHPTIGVFVELVPGLAILPATDGLVEGGVGVRYYF